MLHAFPVNSQELEGKGNSVVDVELEGAIHDLKGVAVMGGPIVGAEVVTFGSRGPGAIVATPMPAPKEPTPAAREKHNLTRPLR